MSCVQQRDLPQRSRIGPSVAIRIEGIDAVVLGGDEPHVMRTFSGDRNPCQIQWLRIKITVHWIGKESSELRLIYVSGCEDRFVCIGSGPRNVIVLRDHICLRISAPRAKQYQQAPQCATANSTASVATFRPFTRYAGASVRRRLEQEHRLSLGP